MHLHRLHPLLAFGVALIVSGSILAGAKAILTSNVSATIGLLSQVLIAILVVALSGAVYFVLANDRSSKYVRVFRTAVAGVLAPVVAGYAFLFIGFVMLGWSK